MAYPASDSFAGYSDWSLLSSQTNWTALGTGSNITCYGGGVFCGETVPSACRWNADGLPTASQYSEVILNVGNWHYKGVGVYMHATTEDYYAFLGNDNSESHITEVISGTQYVLSGGLTQFTDGDTIRLEATTSGGTSTLEAFINGTSEASTTDTTRVSGYVGLADNGDTGSGNLTLSWEGGDLAAAGTDISATTDALVITENVVTVNAETSLTATLDTLAITEYPATIFLDVPTPININATADTLVLTEYPVTVDLAAIDVNVNATTDVLALTEYVSNVNAEVNRQAGLDALVLTEYPLTITRNINVNTVVDVLSIIEYQGSITLAPPPPPSTSRWVSRNAGRIADRLDLVNHPFITRRY